MSSFKASRSSVQREGSLAGEALDPYWGRPLNELAEQQLSMRRTLSAEEPMEPGTSSDVDVIPDLKLWALFKYHLKDWAVIVLCLILDVILNVVHPYHRYVGSFNLDTLRYPLKKNTVPIWSVPIYAVLLPILIFFCYFLKRRNTRDFHHAILGLLTAVLLTAVITDAVKDGVGRPRPNFFWRCFPDGNELFDPDNGDVICHGDPGVVREGYKSFPSGHTSWSFAGLGYLSFYLSGKLVIFDRRGFTSRLFIVVLPLLAATMVGVSRVDDYWHHWQDVFVGGILGLSVAYFSYKQHFPDFGDKNAHLPYPHISLTTSIPLAAHGSHHPGYDTRPLDRPMVNGSSGYDVESARM